MNWLAHVYLSDDDVEFRLGNILADVIKGKDRKELSPGVRHGMACHRAIDAFTDFHPLVGSCKRLVQSDYRPYAGIVLDVYFDHILANQWHQYSDVNLEIFLRELYDSFHSYARRLPEPAQTLIRRIAQEDWFGQYRHIEVIEFVLSRISRRLKRPATFQPALDEVRRNHEVVERAFHEFFLELREHTENWIKLNQVGDEHQ